jgi:8-oxo-dGTP pyrophosphatase MutT (NUDIX family)
MRTYTAVLAFTCDGQKVAMVKKNAKRFADLGGKWNGIGGGIEIGEAPASAAAREFTEETGLPITKDDLVGFEHQRFNILTPSEVHIYWYAAWLPEQVVLPPENDVGELLGLVQVRQVQPFDPVFCPNLGYLVPKAWTYLNTEQLDRPC